MSMIQIPARLLCHSAVYKVYSAKNIHGEPEDEPFYSCTLENVRINLERISSQTDSLTKRTVNAKLYYDCKNSSPTDVEFVVPGDTLDGNVCLNSVIEYKGEIFRIVEIKKVYGYELHHIELDLAKDIT